MAAVLIWFFLIHQTTLTVKELCRTKRTSTEVDKVSLGNQETYGATSNKDSTSFIQDDESGRDSLLRKASFHSQSPEYNKEFTYHFLYRYALITVQIIGIAVLPTLFWQAYITSEAPLAFLFNSFHARSTVEKVFIELYYSHFASSALLIVYALALDIAYFSVLYPTLLVKNSPSPPSRERGIPMSRSQNSLSNVEDEDRNRGAFLDSKP